VFVQDYSASNIFAEIKDSREFVYSLLLGVDRRNVTNMPCVGAEYKPLRRTDSGHAEVWKEGGSALRKTVKANLLCRIWYLLCKGKVFPLQAWGSGRLRLRIFLTFGTVKLVRSSHLRTDRLYPQEYPGTHVYRGWVDPRAHGSVGSFGNNPQRHHCGSIPRSSD
jgi:hypothetical protein